MELVTWIITAIAFTGTVLNSFQKRIGFVFWLISNSFWIVFNLHTGVYAQAALFALNTIMCIVGLIQWKKDKKEKKL